MKTRPNLKGKVAIPTSTEYDASMLTGEATQDATQKSAIESMDSILLCLVTFYQLSSVNASSSAGKVVFAVITGSTTSKN